MRVYDDDAMFKTPNTRYTATKLLRTLVYCQCYIRQNNNNNRPNNALLQCLRTQQLTILYKLNNKLPRMTGQQLYN